MLVILLSVLCVLLFAAALLQSIRLHNLRQKMQELRQTADADARRQDALWHTLIHDLRNPAACVFTLTELIQNNRNGDPAELAHFLDDLHTASAQLLNILTERIPPRLTTKSTAANHSTSSDAANRQK